jgi:hypothetical protein
MFAELLVQAQGYGDADEIAKTMSLVDIIYEMKKAEQEKKPKEEISLTKEPEKKVDSEPEEVKKAGPSSTEEPQVIVKIKDFWSRLTHDSDTDD